LPPEQLERRFLIGAACFLALYTIGIVLAPSELFLRLQSNIVYNLAPPIALPFVLRRTRSGSALERRGGAAMAVVLATWFVGDCVYTVYELGFSQEPPYPGTADLAYLTGDVAFLIALPLLTYTRGPSTRYHGLLDALLLTVLAACLQWELVLAPLFAESASLGEMAVSIIYPMTDLALVAIVLGAVFASGGRLTKRSLTLFAGASILAVADTIYVSDLMGAGYDNSGNPLELAWLAFYFSIGLAATQPAGVEDELKANDSIFWLAAPYALALPLPILLAARVFQDVEPGSLILGSAGVLLVIFMKQVVTLVQNSRALATERKLGRADALTGALNRRAIVEEIEGRIAFGGGRFAMALVDLDKLKLVNDEFGHGAGDLFLKTVVASLNGQGRLVGRYGGDEFLVMKPVRESADAELFERSLRESLAATALVLEGEREISVGASLGVAVFPDDGPDLAHLLEVADAAMYLQKKSCPREPHPPSRLAVHQEIMALQNPAA
jgi:diguanylate cyclase (GGDEF)-like protein